MNHVWHKCDEEDCIVCRAGFKECVVCKATEGELAKHCPSYALDEYTRRRVHQGRLNYVAGEWVRLSVSLARTEIDHAVTVSTAYVPRQIQGHNVDTFETIIFNEDMIAKMYFHNNEEQATAAHYKIVAGLQEVGCAVCRQPLDFNILDDRLDSMGRPWCKFCTEKHDSIDWDDVCGPGQEVLE